MKTKLNLQLKNHINLLQSVAYQSINGITVNEVLKLKNALAEDRYKYFNLIKLRYTVPLGLLALNYLVDKQIEQVLLSYITHILGQLPTENLALNSIFNLGFY